MRILAAGSPDAPVETIRALRSELAAVGLPVAGVDAGAAPRFDDATSTRLRSFQNRYRLPPTGDLDPITGGVLSLSALVATERDRVRLREALRGALSGAPRSPDFDQWLARYALVAGDRELAARASPRLVDLSGVHVDLSDLLVSDGGGGPPRRPEVPFPENFYSYRYGLMAPEDIAALRAGRTQGAGTGTGTGTSMRILARRAPSGFDARDGEFGMEVAPPDPSDTPPATDRAGRLAESAEAWLDALEAWQTGNAEFARQRYASAVGAYDRCQQAALDYFSIHPDHDFHLTPRSLHDFRFPARSLPYRIDELVRWIATDPSARPDLWEAATWRHNLLSLAELHETDWTPIGPLNSVYLLLQANLSGRDYPLGPEHRGVLMDFRILVIAAVLVPLARAEANRLRRQYGAARWDLARFLRPDGQDPATTAPSFLRCQFIEVPFAQLLLAETMLEEAEAQFKARLTADAEPDPAARAAALARLGAIAADFQARQVPGDAAGNAVKPLQHLVAAITYADLLEVIWQEGSYVANARSALDALNATVESTVASGDVTSLAFRSLGQAVTLPTVSAIDGALAGRTDGAHPHEPYLQFQAPGGGVLADRNPRVYALLLQAEARLLQIWNGFNFLGYAAGYVPPWRFAYLLDRARYFAEHAKNVQRDYLNFLSNAENEEYKELSAGQAVELEKANVQIETARVQMASMEVQEASESADLAALHAQHAQESAEEYAEFEAKADEADAKSLVMSILGGEAQVAGGMAGGSGAGVGGGLLSLWDTLFWSGPARYDASIAQRNMERHNLERAAAEALLAAGIAQTKVGVARAGLVVAGLQRQATLLRHEFALQNLQFMRNRVLNTEQWYRLAGAIRSVADTYLRYAIEMAFLAQQAYGFEADRRLDVIRFDYDQSDVGAMLAADFLLRDLDTLEQDLIVSHRTRQQQVRYVLSLAREFPEALRTLAETGETLVGLRLEQLERHFPGLFNLRIVSVEMQPVALADPSRTSVELTHLGTGMVRLKAEPGASPLNASDLAPAEDWLAAAAASWPVKTRVSGPETALFTGFARQEAAGLSMIAASQRGAFEGLPAASSWRIGLSSEENQIVPGSLADVLITFMLSGYHDPELRAAVDAAAPRALAVTSMVSARRMLPDAYYSLVHHGRLHWDVSPRMLALAGSPDRLHNLAILLPPPPAGPELGRGCCRYPIRLTVAPGAVTVASALPEFSLTPNGLALACEFIGAASTQVTWDFGDDTPLVHGHSTAHNYARPGRYEVLVRLAASGRLAEYRGAVVMSERHQTVAPLVVVPEFSAGTLAPDGTVPLTVALPAGVDDVSLECAVGQARGRADAGAATLNVTPGEHVLILLATRRLSARFYGRQCYDPATPVALPRWRVTTNRTFDTAGAETTAAPNAFATRIFGDGSQAVSPVDRWTLELPLAENPWFLTVSPSDAARFDGSELSDAVLSLEFLSQ